MRLNKCDSNIKKKIIDMLMIRSTTDYILYILDIIRYYIIYNQIKHLVTERSLKGL